MGADRASIATPPPLTPAPGSSPGQALSPKGRGSQSPDHFAPVSIASNACQISATGQKNLRSCPTPSPPAPPACCPPPCASTARRPSRGSRCRPPRCGPPGAGWRRAWPMARTTRSAGWRSPPWPRCWWRCAGSCAARRACRGWQRHWLAPWPPRRCTARSHRCSAACWPSSPGRAACWRFCRTNAAVPCRCATACCTPRRAFPSPPCRCWAWRCWRCRSSPRCSSTPATRCACSPPRSAAGCCCRGSTCCARAAA